MAQDGTHVPPKPNLLCNMARNVDNSINSALSLVQQVGRQLKDVNSSSGKAGERLWRDSGKMAVICCTVLHDMYFSSKSKQAGTVFLCKHDLSSMSYTDT